MSFGVTTVRFLVDNIEATRKHFDVLRVYRSATSTGTFTETTTAATRIPLEANKVIYTFDDVAGTGNSWYQFDFFNTRTAAASARSPIQSADAQDAYDILSPDELRQLYLFGLNTKSADTGEELPDEVYAHYIRAAVAVAERRLDLPIRTRVFDETAVDAKIDGVGGAAERLDFLTPEYFKYIWLQLDHYPIVSVSEIRLVLPNNQEVIKFDPTWFQIDALSGQVMIIPDSGQAAVIVLGQTGAWLPMIYGWTDFIPNVFRIKYTAGMGSPFPSDLKHLIGMLAAIPILDILGDLILGAGIARKKLSMDGLSEEVQSTASPTNAGYGARSKIWRAESENLLKQLHRYWKGLPFQVA